MSNYWNEKEEEAIRKIIKNENEKDKEILYTEVVQPAFKKLIRGIYSGYNFNILLPDYEQIEHDALSHLYDKMHKFDPNRQTKSFSYFGTIIKNWLIQRTNRAKKNIYIDNLENKDYYITNISTSKYKENKEKELIYEFIETISKNIDDFNDEIILDEVDKEVIYVIKDILDKKLEIFNKKQLYLYLKEATNLQARKITKSLSKIRERYENIKNEFNR